MIDDRLLTVTEAAGRLRANPETIRRMLRDGRLRGSQPLGKRGGWRIADSELRRLIADPPRRRALPPRPGQSNAVLLANLRGQAERARARGDLEAAAHFELMAEEASR
jgi:excisionase family DNA binding protein